MGRHKKANLAAGEGEIAKKTRANPIRDTLTKVRGLHHSAVIYKCEASSYWQFRVYLEGKLRKRTTQEIELDKAQRKAKLIYADMVISVNSGETKAEPSSRRSLDIVAKSLWAKNLTRIKNGELHKDKVNKDQYVYERHIKPFFGQMDIKTIDTDQLELFKSYLADRELSAGSQLSYLNLVISLLKEAQLKKLITNLPPKPRVRIDDGVRGYFDDSEFSKLWSFLAANEDMVYDAKDGSGRTYRKTHITEELRHLAFFMVHTYIRPTDIKVIKHQDIRLADKGGLTFLVLEHEKTKRHTKNMVSTELGLSAYQRVLNLREREGIEVSPDSYVFLPGMLNRDTALQKLSAQFNAALHITGMTHDRHGKPRTLYSLRHTAIVRSLRKGIPIELVASNSRTSPDMIRRFYGSHIDSSLETGTLYVDKAREQREAFNAKFGGIEAEIIKILAEEADETAEGLEESAETAKLQSAIAAHHANAVEAAAAPALRKPTPRARSPKG